MKTLTAAADQPPTDPYATYRQTYQALMERMLSGMQRSLRLSGRN